MWFLFGMKLQGDAADAGDSLQNRERVAGVFSVLQAGNHGLRGANPLSEFRLNEIRILSHLAHQYSQINLVQGACERLTVGGALSRSLRDDFLAERKAKACRAALCAEGGTGKRNALRASNLRIFDSVQRTEICAEMIAYRDFRRSVTYPRSVVKGCTLSSLTSA
jgi:hypothetical protein